MLAALAPASVDMAGGETIGETKAKTRHEPVPEIAAIPILERVESLHDHDRWSDAEEPRLAEPVWKKLWIGIVHRVRIRIRIGSRSRRRNLIELRRQPGRVLGNLPAPVRLRAGLNDRTPRLATDCDGSSVAAAGTL